MALQVDTSDYKRIAAQLKGADKKIKAAATKAAKDAGKPLGKFVAVAAGRALPQRGGLGYRVASATVTVQSTAMKAAVNLKTREGYDLAAMNRGEIRHPTYGNKNAWVKQDIEADLFTDPFEEGAPAVLKEMTAAMQRVLDQLGE